MKDTYHYVIHAYEDARQKRPIKHEHGGTTVLTDGAEALGRAEELAKEFPDGWVYTSTLSTEGRRSRWRPRMARAGTIVLLLLAAGCSVGNGSEPSADAPRDLRVARISSGAPGQGPEQPQVILASSATTLSRAMGANVPDSGNGTYLAAYWGEKPTGGYSLAVRSARLEGSRVTVRLALKEPPPDVVVTQALTYPYAVAVLRDLDPRDKKFSFVDQNGRKLDWPVRLADA